MAEKKSSGKKGNILTRKVGPLPTWGWLGVGAGTFLVFRYIAARRAASSSAPQLSGGNTIPTDITGPVGTSTPTYSSITQWEQAAIAAMANGTLDPATALNGLTDWLNGQCVSADQYKGISGIISTIGLPPGYGSGVPALTVCGSPTSTGGGATNPTPSAPAPNTGGPPGPPPNAPAAATENLGPFQQYVVDTQWNPVYQEWTYLTNLGGIFNESGSGGQPSGGFFGSIFNLGAGPQGPHAGWFGGPYGELRKAQSLKINPDGGYTIIDTAGESYTFGPNQNFANASGS